jgi:hypothetical protein
MHQQNVLSSASAMFQCLKHMPTPPTLTYSSTTACAEALTRAQSICYVLSIYFHTTTERNLHPRVNPDSGLCIKSESPRRSSHFEARASPAAAAEAEAAGGGRRRRSLREVFVAAAARRPSLTPPKSERGRASLCVQVREEDDDEADDVAAAALVSQFTPAVST